MKRINKLTPNLIKKIMQEERQKIKLQLEKESEVQKQKLLEQLRLLKKVVNVQNSANKKSKSIDNLKLKLIKKLRE